MSHEEIGDLLCPRCGCEMENGYISGQYSRLRWCRKAKTKTIFSGKPLKKKRDLWNAPTLTAMKCCSCKIGIFSYDNDV